MRHRLTFTAPLFTDWTTQHAIIHLPGATPGQPLRLMMNGTPTPFQYTGEVSERGAAIMVRLGFSSADDTRELVFASPEDAVAAAGVTGNSVADLTPLQLDLSRGMEIGDAACRVAIAAPIIGAGGEVAGPFAACAGRSTPSSITCDAAFEGATLTRTNVGALYSEYALVYRFADGRFYRLRLRCYVAESYVEVAEHFGLRLGARLEWTLNPGGPAAGAFDSIVTHRGPEFEGEPQPVVQALGQTRIRDLLCRLQMPVLSEYFVPNNRYYFAFFRKASPEAGMLGIMGLYGGQWEMPVEGMPLLYEKGGTVLWTASLESGARHWLLHAGALEIDWTTERRFVYHRLHAEFNAMRLDEHLDLCGDTLYDTATWSRDGVFAGPDFHAQAAARLAALAPLQRIVAAGPSDWDRRSSGGHTVTFGALLDPSPENLAAVHAYLNRRFTRWVRQFQGWRVGTHDYMKNVIGFSRWLRGMLIAYELLRKDACLSDTELKRLNAYFVFAARRITDEGRWPHERSWRHPDHPESVRDLYTYGGEHKPDKLVWTNSLPNFQSDPMCALAHLSAIFPEHPDAAAWQRKSLDDIDRQLTAYSGRSGAWEESINYALYTLSYLVITFRPLKYRLGIDYFNDTRVRAYVAWLVRFFGPKDCRFNAYSFPPIGNSQMPSGGGAYLMSYAGELAPDDPLRADCVAIFQSTEANETLGEHYPTVLAAMAPLGEPPRPIPGPFQSEWMDDIGVMLRDKHLQPTESLLFQKIGFVKDHYEGDETAFSWHAKGVPLAMDYGTYTGDVGIAAAHNLVEIPDMDALRRGYLGDHLFTAAVDYTRCEVPVTIKLMWDRMRSFAEVDGKDGIVNRMDTPYFYIGDPNPVGPKIWKMRQMLWVKPDYMAVLDRVYGEVPHRWNFHAVADDFTVDGQHLHATGRFGVDVRGFMQHPATFKVELGEITPNFKPNGRTDVAILHNQRWCRVYNTTDGLYRAVLFSQAPGEDVSLSAAGDYGIRVATGTYTDYVFLNPDPVRVALPTDGVSFYGRVGWIRRWHDGRLQAAVPDGDSIGGFGLTLTGRGPWTYGVDTPDTVTTHGPTPRHVDVKRG